MKKKLLALIFICLHTCIACFAQNKFIKRVSLASYIQWTSAIESPIDSSCYFMGRLANTGSSVRPFLTKCDKNGNILWSKNYNFSIPLNHGQVFIKGALSVQADQIALIGWASNDTTINDEIYSIIAIVDTAGNVIKSVKYKPITDFVIQDIISTNDSGFATVGMYNYIQPNFATDTVYATITKFDRNLNQQWTKLYTGDYLTYGTALLQLKDSGFIFTGTARDSAITTHLLITRIDKNGAVLWSKRSNLFQENVSTGNQFIALISDSILWVSCENYGGSVGGSRIDLVQLKIDGTLLTYRGQGTPGVPINRGLICENNNELKILVNGTIETVDSNGVLINRHWYNGGELLCTLTKVYNGFIYSGYSNNSIIYLKTDTTLNFNCYNIQLSNQPFYNINPNLILYQITSKPLFLNEAALSYLSHDTIIVAYDLCGSEISDNMNLVDIEVYPNPNDGVFNLYRNNIDLKLSIEIYNSQGVMLHKESEFLGNKEIDLRNFQNDIYLIKIYNESFYRSIKVIKNE